MRKTLFSLAVLLSLVCACPRATTTIKPPGGGAVPLRIPVTINSMASDPSEDFAPNPLDRGDIAQPPGASSSPADLASMYCPGKGQYATAATELMDEAKLICQEYTPCCDAACKSFGYEGEMQNPSLVFKKGEPGNLPPVEGKLYCGCECEKL